MIVFARHQLCFLLQLRLSMGQFRDVLATYMDVHSIANGFVEVGDAPIKLLQASCKDPGIKAHRLSPGLYPLPDARLKRLKLLGSTQARLQETRHRIVRPLDRDHVRRAHRRPFRQITRADVILSMSLLPASGAIILRLSRKATAAISAVDQSRQQILTMSFACGWLLKRPCRGDGLALPKRLAPNERRHRTF